MKTEITDTNSTIVTCTFCDSELELDSSELFNRQFICPQCGEETYLEDSLIHNLEVAPNKINKVEVSDQIWFGMWFMVVFCFSIALYLFIKSNDRTFPFMIALMVLCFIQIYRIMNTGKLVFMQDSIPIKSKVNIARKIQELMRWDIVERRGSYFVFRDKYFTHDHEITFICSEEGYYFHCMSTNPNLSGVSLAQTWRVKNVMKKLSSIAA